MKLNDEGLMWWSMELSEQDDQLFGGISSHRTGLGTLASRRISTCLSPKGFSFIRISSLLSSLSERLIAIPSGDTSCESCI